MRTQNYFGAESAPLRHARPRHAKDRRTPPPSQDQGANLLSSRRSKTRELVEASEAGGDQAVDELLLLLLRHYREI